jgi:ISXO2 transposase-like protein
MRWLLVEDGGAGPGRLRLAELSDYSRPTACIPSSPTTSRRGRSPRPMGGPAYPGAPGVSHDPHVIGKMAAHVVLPWAHRIFSNLKVWALGVYHGLRRKHLQSYLDEFVFRFNRRRTRHAAFRSLRDRRVDPGREPPYPASGRGFAALPVAVGWAGSRPSDWRRPPRPASSHSIRCEYESIDTRMRCGGAISCGRRVGRMMGRRCPAM